MRSTSGQHFIALDHVRALAAFMVVTWHFNHGFTGYPVPFEHVPSLFPVSLLEEGHTGVALFMTLSGYLFAKLLAGRTVHFPLFFWNRALRLLPLLIVVLVLVGIRKVRTGEETFASYLVSVAQGVVLPTWSNGGWSITVELHFYLLLPLLLWLGRKSRWLLPATILVAIVFRAWLLHERGEVQSLAYFTLVGRIDQFLLGMIAFQCRPWLAGRHLVGLATLAGFMYFYGQFDAHGGFAKNYPSPSALWVFMPTIEGFAYAVGIAWYESSFRHSSSAFSRFVARMGEYSYSIYLLHVFFVFNAASWVHDYVIDISNLYLACFFSLLFFLCMVIPGYLSFRFIESPFLKMRRQYLIPDTAVAGSLASGDTGSPFAVAKAPEEPGTRTPSAS